MHITESYWESITNRNTRYSSIYCIHDYCYCSLFLLLFIVYTITVTVLLLLQSPHVSVF